MDMDGAEGESDMDMEGMQGMTMQEVDGIDIPAGETVALEPGGYHVMMHRPGRAARGRRDHRVDAHVRARR